MYDIVYANHCAAVVRFVQCRHRIIDAANRSIPYFNYDNRSGSMSQNIVAYSKIVKRQLPKQSKES